MKKIEWGPVPSMIGWNKIKALRKCRALTQLEVAAGAGISIACLYYLESGFESRVTEKTKKKLAGFFAVDVDDLFPVEMVGDVPRDVFLQQSQKRAKATGRTK